MGVKLAKGPVCMDKPTLAATLTLVTASREIYQERERLKESRNSLLTAAAQPAVTQPLAGAAPDNAALQLQQDPQQLQQPGAERL